MTIKYKQLVVLSVVVTIRQRDVIGMNWLRGKCGLQIISKHVIHSKNQAVSINKCEII